MNRRVLYLLSFIAALVMPAVGYAQGPGTVKLELELPKPRFIGTPKNLKTPNLEPARNAPRPAYYVPEGTTNVALNKPVAASDKEPVIGEPELVTDGDKEGVEGSYVEFGPQVQWVQIDLEKPTDIYAIVLWHFHNEPRVYRDVVVQASDDPDFTANVHTIFNNDHDNSAGLGVGKNFEYIETYEGKLIEVKRTKARYLRFYSDGNTANEMNHYTEIEVYGKPAA